MSPTARFLSRAAVAGAIVVAAAAAFGTARARRREPGAGVEVDEDVRDAIAEGMATGGHGETADEAVRWIPLNGQSAERDAAAVAAADDTPATAYA